jgi:uncharacterized membrane protein
MVMNVKRFWRHVLMSPTKAARMFPAVTLDAIEREIALQEQHHRGEVCCVIEAELASGQLWRELSSRERAKEVFAARGVWNTEENNGVLIYVLLADRRVEIVADRGVDARVSQDAWQDICRMMERHFGGRRFEEGAIAGVRAVSAVLREHFPATSAGRNELPDRPILI